MGEVVKQLSYSWAVAYITGTPSFYVLRTLTNSQVCNKGFVTKKKVCNKGSSTDNPKFYTF